MTVRELTKKLIDLPPDYQDLPVRFYTREEVEDIDYISLETGINYKDRYIRLD